MWIEHLSRPFPEVLADQEEWEIDGIDLVMLDATIAGYVSRFVSGSYHDELEHTCKALRVCLKKLDAVIRKLRGESRIYYEEWWLLCHAALILASQEIDQRC
jgi:hypothetical protein